MATRSVLLLLLLAVAGCTTEAMPPGPVPVPADAKAVFYEVQSWETGGKLERLMLRADGSSALTITEEGRAFQHTREDVLPRAEAKQAFEGALEAGIHLMEPVRPSYLDGGGVLVGAEVGSERVEASVASHVQPESADANWLRFQAIAEIFTPLMEKALAPRLEITAHWADVTSPTRGPNVTFENLSEGPLVILPNAMQFEIKGPGAVFSPFPGPPIDPRGRAFALAPGARQTVEPIADGVWKLPPGEYRGSGRYEVSEKMAGEGLPEGELWVGRLWARTGRFTIADPAR